MKPANPPACISHPLARRRFLALVSGGLLAAPLAAEAQKPGKVWRIGFLGPGSPEAYADLLQGLRARLRELGYAEGTIVFEHRFAEDKYDRLPSLAAELVRSKADVILAAGSPAIRPTKQATSIIPIVMIGAGDPVATGFVASLARPGGNVTGVSTIDAVLAPKRLQLLKEVLPKLSRVAVLRNPANLASELQIREVQAAARALGIEPQAYEVRDPKELENVFSVIAKARAEALTVDADPMFLSQRNQIANLTLTKRLPSVFARDENVKAGGLMSYGPTLVDQFHLATTYVDKILKGAKPGDLPVEEPTRTYLVINLKIAKALGLTIPESLLRRADAVIQ
jgi:putative tryptophan/tyrosine transport system substrate-binding protein